MSPGRFAYLATTLVFALGAVAVVWGLKRRELTEHGKVLGCVALLGVIGTLLAEPVALRWRCWAYNPRRTLDVFVGGAAAETLVFAILVSVAIAGPALIWGRSEERRAAARERDRT